MWPGRCYFAEEIDRTGYKFLWKSRFSAKLGLHSLETFFFPPLAVCLLVCLYCWKTEHLSKVKSVNFLGSSCCAHFAPIPSLLWQSLSVDRQFVTWNYIFLPRSPCPSPQEPSQAQSRAPRSETFPLHFKRGTDWKVYFRNKQHLSAGLRRELY